MNKASVPEFKIIDIKGKYNKNKLFRCIHSYIIYYKLHGTLTLLSLPSQYIKAKSLNSLDTSVRYANIIKKFFSWYAKEHMIKNLFWQNVRKDNIQEWQIDRWTEREKKGIKKPSNKTILDEAVLIAEMYDWIHEQGYYSGVKIDKKKVVIDFNDNDMLNYVKERTTKEVVDNRSLQVVKRESFVSDVDFTLMDKTQMETFLKGFSDKVYVCIFYLILCTGFRRSEVMQIPYIGEGVLAHVLQFDQMDLEYRNSDFFKILVLGKGKKQRKPKIPTRDWAFICELYESDLIERRKLYKKKYGKQCPNHILWLTKTGEPVTRKSFTDAFTYNSDKTGIHIHPHDGRGWYATNFIIKAFGDRLNTTVGYNLAVDEELRVQLGHSNIKTTYEHYLKIAKLFVNINNGFTTDLFSEGNTILSDFNEKDEDINKTRNIPVNHQNHLLMIRGLPGSGKSTIAKMLSAYVHYETDMFFMKNTEYKFRKNKLQAAHEWCQDQVLVNLQQGNDVVVSNTFVTLRELQPYIDMGFDYKILTATGEFENEHGITSQQVQEMKEKWEDIDSVLV